jgi:hypothetical protein
MGAAGSLLVVAASVMLFIQAIKFHLTEKITFMVALIVEAMGGVVYIVHLFPHSSPILDLGAFVLFVTAFTLFCLDLLIKPS